MKKKAAFLIGLTFISQSVSAIEKPLVLTTTVDINNLYADSITNVEFSPAVLELDLNENRTGFEKKSTVMQVYTTIPMGASSVSYTSTMTSNNSTCTNFLGQSYPQDELVYVSFDDSKLDINVPILLDDFNSNDGVFKYSEHTVDLEVKPFSDIEVNGSPKECSGDITFTIGVDI
ncbi:hypothetical protein [Vibrio owensii]|uniref:hypothetical protein n=1 Tax=Vibrio owensii TaxID=696485 RepID=UPI003DA19B02